MRSSFHNYTPRSALALSLALYLGSCEEFTCADYATCPIPDAGDDSTQITTASDAGATATRDISLDSPHALTSQAMATVAFTSADAGDTPSQPNEDSVFSTASSCGSACCDENCLDASLEFTDSAVSEALPNVSNSSTSDDPLNASNDASELFNDSSSASNASTEVAVN